MTIEIAPTILTYLQDLESDAEHPDWASLWNPVYTLQPNPDDIYLQSPIRCDLTYRLSGNRGTCRILSFTTQKALSGTVDEMPQPGGHNEVDHTDLGLEPGEDFEVVFSAERPAGGGNDYGSTGLHWQDRDCDGRRYRHRLRDGNAAREARRHGRRGQPDC